MPDLLTQERVQEYLALALNYDPCYIEPVCRTLLAYMEGVENAQHGAECASLTGMIHEEPCRFWTLNVCLTEKDIYGVVLDENATCHRPPCDCWKSRIGK